MEYMPWPLAAECNMITNKQTTHVTLHPTCTPSPRAVSIVLFFSRFDSDTVLIHIPLAFSHPSAVIALISSFTCLCNNVFLLDTYPSATV